MNVASRETRSRCDHVVSYFQQDVLDIDVQTLLGLLITPSDKFAHQTRDAKFEG